MMVCAACWILLCALCSLPSALCCVCVSVRLCVCVSVCLSATPSFQTIFDVSCPPSQRVVAYCGPESERAACLHRTKHTRVPQRARGVAAMVEVVEVVVEAAAVIRTGARGSTVWTG